MVTFDLLIYYIFSLGIRELLDTNNSYRTSSDLLRRWRTVGKSRVQNFTEEARKEWQKEEEEKKRKEEEEARILMEYWFRRYRIKDIPTHIVVGRSGSLEF